MCSPGGAGADTLLGGEGADVLDGGPDADGLYGEAGDDTYRFGRGSGQDVIADSDATPGNTDTARFGATIDPLDLVVAQIGNDLVLSVHATADSLTVRDWYSGSDLQVEVIEAGDGGRLLSAQVQQLIQDMATYTASTGLTWDQAIDQRPDEVQVVLAAHWQPA